MCTIFATITAPPQKIHENPPPKYNANSKAPFPITHLASKDRIGGVQVLATLGVHAQETHDGAAFPDCAVVVCEFERGCRVAGVHGEEFGRARLAVAVDEFDVAVCHEVEVFGHRDAAV